MRKNVMLSIQGKQTYPDQEPEIIELVTEGVLTDFDGGWELQYEESDLTGLEGVTTAFRILPEQIILSRTGRLNSRMVFEEGVFHDSLYELEFGVLHITVCATHIKADISENGGTVDLTYRIEIEQTASGAIEYHLSFRPKED